MDIDKMYKRYLKQQETITQQKGSVTSPIRHNQNKIIFYRDIITVDVTNYVVIMFMSNYLIMLDL